MLRTVLLTIIVFSAVACFAQKRRLAPFQPFKPNAFNERVWFLDSMKQHYTDFITLSESSNWSIKGIVQAIGIKDGKAFFVHLTSYILDTPQIKMAETPLALAEFNKLLDSLLLIGFYRLKDETQIPACSSQKDTVINGRKIVEFRATGLISDVTQTNIVAFSAGKFRVTTYYALQESSLICPGISDWKTALQVRNYLKRFFDRQSR